MSEGTVRLRRLLSVYVIVGDLDRSLKFYRAVIGRSEDVVVPWTDDPEERGAFFDLEGGVRLILSQEKGRTPARSQSVWLEFEVNSASDAYEALRRSGLKPSAPKLGDAGTQIVEIDDPDGNQVRCSERWPLPR